MAFVPVEVECKSCGAKLELDPTLSLGKCLWCGSVIAVNKSQTGSEIPPVDAIFEDRIDEDECRRRLRAFICDNPYVPDELYDQMEEVELYICFIPGYFYHVNWQADWNAESGHNYKNRNDEVITEWRPANGHTVGANRFCGPGSKMIVNRDLGNMFVALAEEMPRGNAKQFIPEMLTGKTWLPYDYEDERSYQNFVLSRLNSSIQEQCAKQVPGDKSRNLRYTYTFRKEVKKTLVPCWVFTYTWKNRQRSIVQEAYRGNISGNTPKTVGRIANLVILSILAVPSLLLFLLFLLRKFQGTLPSELNFLWFLTTVFLVAPVWYHVHCSSARKKFKDMNVQARKEACQKLKRWERIFMIVVLTIFVYACIWIGNNG